MNLIAGEGHRKWPYGVLLRILVAVVALFAGLGIQAPPAVAARPLFFDLFGARPPRLHRTAHVRKVAPRIAPTIAPKIPLPMPRPAEAPAAEPASRAAEKPPAASDKPVAAAPAAPQPSACRAALTEEIAIAPSIPEIHGPGGCGGTDLVRLEAIVLPDKHRVAVTPPATLRCSMATAIADWVRTDIVSLTDKLESRISGLDNYDSYECRGFNGVAGAHLSEHGHANALDVHAFKLADGRSISLTDRTVSRDVRESMLHSACTRFMTVLGPDSDWHHEDHIHIDLMERHNNYKICQWDVLDPLPQIAPLLPAERPQEAPPRKLAAKSDADKDKQEPAKSDAAKSESEPTKSDATKPQTAEDAKPPAPSPAKRSISRKKRR